MTQDTKKLTDDIWDKLDLEKPPSHPPSSPYMVESESMFVPTTKTETLPDTDNTPEVQVSTESNFASGAGEPVTSEAPMKAINKALQENDSLFPPMPKDVLSDQEVVPVAQKGAKEAQPTKTESSAPLKPSSQDKKKKGSVGPLPVEDGGYAKPIKYRSSLKAFYPHFAVVAICGLVAMFPGLGASIFKDEDIAQLPVWLQEHFNLLIQIIMGFVGLLLMVIVVKQKSTGVIKVFGDYLEYRKGLMRPITIHYSDIRTIEVQRCLATLYAPIGDFHVISAREHVVMPNLFDPFTLKEAIEKRRSELKI